MLATEQANRGGDVHIGLRRQGVHYHRLRNGDVVFHQLGDISSKNPWLFFRINELIRKLRPDLVQSWLPYMDILGGVAALWNDVPWIVSERASELAYTRPGWLYWMRRRLGRRASAVVANSSTGGLYWRGTHPVDKCVSTVPNAVDVAAIRRAPLPGQIASIDESKNLLLVVGRLTNQKAIEIVIQAASLIMERDDFRVLIIGDGPLRAEFEVMIDRFRLKNHIAMLPYQEDWWGFLRIARALVTMSRYEGHPNVVLETMVAGCPLIVSDIPEHREFLDDDSACFVKGEDPAALAKAVISVLSDPVSAIQRAGRASRRVDSLTIHAIADAYEAIYGRVMGGKPAQCVES
jgi:glycosyltransferase involved in cell wall biosynthesis